MKKIPFIFLALLLFFSCERDDLFEFITGGGAGLKITAGNGKLDLNWNTVEGATEYQVFWNTINDPDTALFNTATPSTSDTIASLTNGTLYYVWLKVSIAGGPFTIKASGTGTPSIVPDTVINIASITGVTPPNYGGTPVTTITGTAQYTGTVTWSGTPATFAAATVYTATITLTAKPGYTLTGVPANFFTVAGATPVTNPIDSGVVTAVFPATGAVPDTVIDIKEIPGVIAPVKGMIPVAGVDTAQYTGTITWLPPHNPFEAATVYTATITLTAKAGYTLTGVIANSFIVIGATSTNPADSGLITAVFPPTAPLAIGDSYQGGKIAYIFESGDPGYVGGETHGLIAATADQSNGIAWITGGSTRTTLNGLTFTEIGKGKANTMAMMGQTGYTGGAATICDDYTIGIYSDWYLPSKDELNKLYLNKAAIGGFTNNFYWSSSEGSANEAWVQLFDIYDQSRSSKDSLYSVRAIRSF